MTLPLDIPITPVSRRAWFIGGILCLAWMGVMGRLCYLQWWLHPRLATAAQRQQYTSMEIPARAGDIVDRRGRLLATSMARPSLYLVPKKILDRKAYAESACTALSTTAAELEKFLNKHATKGFVWYERRITWERARAFRELKMPRETFGFQDEFLREYPYGDLACHVLGLRQLDNQPFGGLEAAMNDLLAGKPEVWHVQRDALGKVVEVFPNDEAEDDVNQGRTVTSTIDIVLQKQTEEVLDELMTKHAPKSACAIVMAPKTGDVLALASRPSYSYADLAHVPEGGWHNGGLTIQYEPGSTFKPFIVAMALQNGYITKDEMIDCERGAYRMGRRTLHDTHAYGLLSLTDVLVKSSNIGMSKIGEKMGNDALFDAITRFGFGRRTGIELTDELPGLVRPLEQWTSYSTGSVTMGQEISTTPLQILTGTCCLANGGRLIKPRIIRDDEHLPVSSQVVSPEIARWLIEGPMVEVVKRGTGKTAQLKDYTVFGKTGTAQKFDTETGQYSHSKMICSFVGGAPANDPQVCVIVTVDEPTKGGTAYGGVVAGPSCAKIIDRVLKTMKVVEKRDLASEESDTNHR